MLKNWGTKTRKPSQQYTNLAEPSKEGHAPKMAVFTVTMMKLENAFTIMNFKVRTHTQLSNC
jgi:hypothetical protein